jgi:uncharacterized protein (TIGR02145 family)
VQYSSTGSFQFAVPANQSITVQVFNGQNNANTTINSGNLNTSVSAGNLTLCNQGGGGGGGSGCAGGPSTVTDIDGNVYNVAQIGNQCWMKENLKTTKYSNGDTINTGLMDGLWSVITSGAYANYNNTATNDSIYGKLYNGYAVADPRGLCPTGWHVPSQAEWTTLENFLGDSFVAGGKMKAVSSMWTSPNTDATNSSGFTGLPGGFRNRYGAFDGIGKYGYWWSSTQISPTSAWNRGLYHSNAFLGQNLNLTSVGFSVRCVRD